MMELMSETVVWAVIFVALMAIGAFVTFGGKLLSAIGRYIINFFKWQRFKSKKNDFDDLNDFYED